MKNLVPLSTCEGDIGFFDNEYLKDENYAMSSTPILMSDVLVPFKDVAFASIIYMKKEKVNDVFKILRSLGESYKNNNCLGCFTFV